MRLRKKNLAPWSARLSHVDWGQPADWGQRRVGRKGQNKDRKNIYEYANRHITELWCVSPWIYCLQQGDLQWALVNTLTNLPAFKWTVISWLAESSSTCCLEVGDLLYYSFVPCFTLVFTLTASIHHNPMIYRLGEVQSTDCHSHSLWPRKCNSLTHSLTHSLTLLLQLAKILRRV